MSRFRLILVWLLLSVAMVPATQAQADGPPARAEVPKISRQGTWQPAAGGTQLPLWPEGVALAKPDSGDRPEETGNGSTLVAGRE